MAEISIRKYRPGDRRAVKDICVRTSGIPVRTDSQRRFLWTMYNDCYTEQYPDYCFVAVDKRDIPVGYILCAPEYEAYRRIFRQIYLPRLEKRNFIRRIAAASEIKALQAPAQEGYRAHMHIDILKDFQRRGIGTRLLQTLCGRLRSDGISGLCLGVGCGNRKGIAFYQKMGFHILRKNGGSWIMGLSLNQPDRIRQQEDTRIKK